MKLKKIVYALASAGFITSLLAGCGGGGGDGSTAASPAVVTLPTNTTLSITGTAAFGAPMAGATISIKDSSGKTVSAIAAANGNYNAEVTGMTAPLSITASLGSGDAVKLYHALLDTLPAAGQTAVANVTPLTDAITALVSASGTSAAEFDADPSKLATLDKAKIAASVLALRSVLTDVLTQVGVSAADFDPTKSAFVADRVSGGDKLLESIKVALSEQGITLTNVRVSLPANAADAGGASVTLTAKATPAALPIGTVTGDYSPLDSWVSEINACLALPVASRVSVASNGVVTGFLGACAQISGFSATYKRNGYNLLQRWGAQLNFLPQGAIAELPEVLGHFKSDAGRDQVLFRVPVKTLNGGVSYLDVAEKTDAGLWRVIGNQRDFDASVDVRLARIDEVSANGYVPISGPDAGKNVGNFSRYESRLGFHFNPSGPNAANVYAVRITGPGLRAGGLVLARSSSCGTSDYLAYYSDNGVLPPAALAMATSSSSNSWRLAAKPNAAGYTGSDFWAALRGRNADGTPSISSSYAPAPVELSTIPALANYKWEVFTVARGATPSASFYSRIVTRPVGPEFGAQLPWAKLSAPSLEYANPAITAKAGALTSVDLSWTVPVGAPRVYSAYAYGESRSAADGFAKMNLGGNVGEFGTTAKTYSAAVERNGLGAACTTTSLPAFSATLGYREVGVSQTTDHSLVMQQFTNFIGRPAL
jgi:hypothetical protein